MADPIIPAVAPPTVVPVVVPPVVPPVADEELKFSRTALNERLEQAKRSERKAFLISNGFKTEEEFAAFKTAAEQSSKAAQEAERAKLDELGRLKADLDAANKAVLAEKAAREASDAAAEAARTEAHLHSVFASKGIVATDYAFFKIEQALNALPDGQDLDEGAFLDGLLKDPREAFALGIAGAATPAVKPATTTAPATGPAPKTPVAAGDKHASQMTPEEFAAWKRAHGVQ